MAADLKKHSVMTGYEYRCGSCYAFWFTRVQAPVLPDCPKCASQFDRVTPVDLVPTYEVEQIQLDESPRGGSESEEHIQYRNCVRYWDPETGLEFFAPGTSYGPLTSPTSWAKLKHEWVIISATGVRRRDLINGESDS